MQLKYMLLLLSFCIQQGLASQPCKQCGFVIPSQFFGFKIKQSAETNEIVTKLDGQAHDYAPLVAARLITDSDESTVRNLNVMYQDLGYSSNKLLALASIINGLVIRTQFSSAMLTKFMVDRYKIQNPSSEDQFDDYLQVFNDAKIVFFYVPLVLNKIIQGHSIHFKEKYLIKKHYVLLNWAQVNGYVKIPLDANVLGTRVDKFLLAVRQPAPTNISVRVGDICAYLYCLKSCLYILKNGQYYFLLGVYPVYWATFITTFMMSAVVETYVNLPMPVSRQELINRYFLDNDQVVSVEEMNDIIEDAV